MSGRAIRVEDVEGAVGSDMMMARWSRRELEAVI